MQKLYCYVDETEKEHSRQKFIVAVVIITGDGDGLLELYERFVKEAGKGKFKERKAKHEPRMKYLKKVFSNIYIFISYCPRALILMR